MPLASSVGGASVLVSLGVFQVTAPLPECHQAAKVATTKSVTIATQSDRHREGIKYVCFFLSTI